MTISMNWGSFTGGLGLFYRSGEVRATACILAMQGREDEFKLSASILWGIRQHNRFDSFSVQDAIKP